MSKLNLTTIILTYNEELHIRRCLENVCPFSKKVYVIDCFSTDKTCEICAEFPEVEVVQHKWPGNQAAQYNWAVDTLKIDTEWTFRIDADEYLMPELVREIEEKLPSLPKEITGLELKRRHIFMGKFVKHGIYPVIMMRICRTGCGRYADRLMDEHMVLNQGTSMVLDNDFCDHSLINVSDYCRKHLNYAEREAAVVLDEMYQLRGESLEVRGESGFSDLREDESLGKQAEGKHKKKNTYNNLPLFWRSFAYFCFRYFLKGGFLDDKEGFVFAFIQGWWFRMMVDVKILEARKAMTAEGIALKKKTILDKAEKEKLKEYIKREWNLSL
ncbi:MAG: glycosyltransferase family 2 protein [Bacteroides sp.]|nr:glycosyltransferase family 2 protein [Bacteroides sp.]MCM1447175.1 glycosyltransferase family 2 protein [Bacteroides sp.]